MDEDHTIFHFSFLICHLGWRRAHYSLNTIGAYTCKGDTFLMKNEKWKISTVPTLVEQSQLFAEIV